MRHAKPDSIACLEVQCPVCGQPPADQCRSLTNGVKVYPHIDRMIAWRKQQEPPETGALFGESQ